MKATRLARNRRDCPEKGSIRTEALSQRVKGLATTQAIHSRDCPETETKNNQKTTKPKTTAKKNKVVENIENAGTTNLGALLKAKLDDGKDD